MSLLSLTKLLSFSYRHSQPDRIITIVAKSCIPNFQAPIPGRSMSTSAQPSSSLAPGGGAVPTNPRDQKNNQQQSANAAPIPSK
ncbi:hypothetical protein AAHC03_022517 [Spirometra sp. Aus1]